MRPQAHHVLWALKARGKRGITSREALRLLGCARLASRIHDLRDEGYSISVETVKVGNGAHVSRYRLAK